MCDFKTVDYKKFAEHQIRAHKNLDDDIRYFCVQCDYMAWDEESSKEHNINCESKPTLK